MNINEFVRKYKNHPVLFFGAGISVRYYENTLDWNEMLKSVYSKIVGDDEEYYNLITKFQENGEIDYTKVAGEVEKVFNEHLEKKENRNGEYKEVNDYFFERAKKGECVKSRFKIYISFLYKDLKLKNSNLVNDEISELKKARKNVASVITTNYDTFVEKVFQFEPIVGNNILLSNPYGSVYKIHGCVNYPNELIITEQDFENFQKKYRLIRAQLLSIFVHHPIIFMGYNLRDDDIKRVLETIFSCVNLNSNEALQIRDNFLLVEYENGSDNLEVTEFDMRLDNGTNIRINKLKTDNFKGIYKSISSLKLPISAMDIRKVQSVVKNIYSGGDIKVKITEDLDSLENSEKILVIGTKKSIKYNYMSIKEMMSDYFKIIEEENAPLLELIDKQRIQALQFFPIYGFSTICTNIGKAENLKSQQKKKLEICFEKAKDIHYPIKTIKDIVNNSEVCMSNIPDLICKYVLLENIDLDEVKEYLINFDDKNITNYKKILCAYDYVKYSVHNSFKAFKPRKK